MERVCLRHSQLFLPRDVTNTRVATALAMPPRLVYSRPPRPSRPPEPPKPPGGWNHGLCSCLEEFGLACGVCLCACSATGQAYHRATGAGCFLISLSLWAIFVVNQSMYSAVDGLRTADNDGEDHVVATSVVNGVAGFLGIVFSVVTTYFVCTARRIMRQRDAIPTGCCGDCDDCCTGWWCSCCALVQMFRQDGITSDRYRVCTADAV